MSESIFRNFEGAETENTMVNIFGKPGSHLQSIYLVILTALLIFLMCLTFIKIPVFIRTRGILRPSSETGSILSPFPGTISLINVTENQHVATGSVLIKLEADKEILQKNLINSELMNLKLWLMDLRLITTGLNDSSALVTTRYRNEYQLFTHLNCEIDMQLKMAETDFGRNQQLFREKFISQKEYDESARNYNTLRMRKDQLISEKKCSWINQLNEFMLRENILLKQLSEIDFIIEKSTIRAPMKGIVQGIRDNFNGEFCATGTRICNIIPDTGLLAEMFILPKDIGFISPGQKVRLQIDSYDYKYWGILPGECSSISEDVEIIENQALFRVICRLDSDPYLEYRNVKVFPGKGMTLTAQFLVTEKTAIQLIWDETFTTVLRNQVK